MTEHYWGLPTLATFIRWLEELIAILSKPFLMLGFIISMVDLLTQGRLLDIWLIYYGWAVIQAIAVDACFFVTWHKAKKAILSGYTFQFVGYALLGLALGIVAWAAMDLQSLEQAVGISNAEALARLNLNPVLLTHLRSLVAVIMGAIVAMISPEDHKNVHVKSGKKLPGFMAKIMAKWGKKPQGNQPVPPPQSEEKRLKMKPSQVVGTMTKIGQETAKNEQPGLLPVMPVLPVPLETNIVKREEEKSFQCERFEWPVALLEPIEYQQDFTLVEHTVPEEIEPENEVVESEQEEDEEEYTEEAPIDPMQLPKMTVTRKQSGSASKRVYKVLKGNPEATVSEIVKRAKVSSGYASKLKAKFLSEQSVVQLAGNNHH